MLQAHTSYVWSALWLLLVGIGSGMFNSPNTAAMMGVVPVHRRGIAAGARVMLQNTGAVISIAFVMAIVTAAVPTGRALQDLLRPHLRPLRPSSCSRSSRTCTSRSGCSPASRCSAPAISMLRPAHVRTADQPVELKQRRRRMTLRIGEIAERSGVTPRTIRYYEELGLLPRGERGLRQAPPLHAGGHRAAPGADAAARPARPDARGARAR